MTQDELDIQRAEGEGLPPVPEPQRGSAENPCTLDELPRRNGVPDLFYEGPLPAMVGR